jgi:hypothetical protein
MSREDDRDPMRAGVVETKTRNADQRFCGGTLKRLVIMSLATVSIGILLVGSASAKELVLRPQLKIVPDTWIYSCASPLLEQIAVEPIPSNTRCNGTTPASYSGPFQGYYLTSYNYPCIRNRPVSVDVDGKTVETHKFGEFQGQGALFHPPTSAGWPPGELELVSPQVTFRTKVVKGEHGKERFPAKIVCAPLTLKLGPT